MKMSPRTKVIVGILGLVLVLALVYVTFFANNSTSAITIESGQVSPETQTFLDLANRIDPISFDTSVLGDPRFSSLVDIHTAVIPVPVGRKDPFASVPGIGGSSASQSSSATQSQ